MNTLLAQLQRTVNNLRYYNPVAIRPYRNDNVRPIIIFFNISSVCNARCAYCEKWRQPKRTMSYEHFAACWSRLHKAFRPKSIMLSGGEPFLHPRITDIIEYLSGFNGLEINCVTNGTIRIPERALSRLNALHFSLDGSSQGREHGARKGISADSVLSNIRRCLDERRRSGLSARIGVMSVITRHNYMQLEENILFFRSLGVDEVALQPAARTRHDDAHAPDKKSHDMIISTLLSLKKRHGSFIANDPGSIRGMFSQYTGRCYAGRAFMAVDEMGDCYPCYQCRKPMLSLLSQEIDKERLKKAFPLSCKEGCSFFCNVQMNRILSRLDWL